MISKKKIQKNVEKLIDKAKQLFFDRNHQKVLEICNKITDFSLELADLYYYKGLSLSELQRSDEAIYAFNESLRCYGDNFEKIKSYKESSKVYVDIGINLCVLSDRYKAIGYFESAIEIDSNNAEAHFQFALTLDDIGRGYMAITEYEKAIQLDENIYHIYHQFGLTLQAEGYFERALEAFSKSIELDENNHSSYRHKLYLLEKLKKYPELKDFQEFCNENNLDLEYSFDYSHDSEDSLDSDSSSENNDDRITNSEYSDDQDISSESEISIMGKTTVASYQDLQ